VALRVTDWRLRKCILALIPDNILTTQCSAGAILAFCDYPLVTIGSTAEESLIKAGLVKLRYFAGLSVEKAACDLDISPETAKYYWAYSRVWLNDAMKDDEYAC
jgi:hypothetical protein